MKRFPIPELARSVWILALVCQLTTSPLAMGQEKEPTYWWTKLESGDYRRNLAALPNGNSLIILPSAGVFEGSSLDSMSPALSNLEFDLVENYSAVMSLSNGTVLISGFNTSGDHYYVRRASETTFRLLNSADLGGATTPWIESATALEPDLLIVKHSYSTDNGQTWTLAIPMDSAGVLVDATYLPGQAIYARSQTTGLWYSLQLGSNKWQPTTFGANVSHLVWLANGAAVMVEKEDGIDRRIKIRSSQGAEWTTVQAPIRDDGTVIKFDASGGVIGPVVRVNDSTAAIALNDGVVLVTNGSSVRSYSFPQFYSSYVSKPHIGIHNDTVGFLYTYAPNNRSNSSALLMDCKTGESRIIDIPYSYTASGGFAFHKGMVVRLDYGILSGYDSGLQSWRPMFKAYRESGPVSPATHPFITRVGDQLLSPCISQVLAIAPQTGALPTVASYPVLTSPWSSTGFFTGSESFVSTPNGLLLKGERTFIITQDQRKSLRADLTSAVTWNAPQRLFSANAVLHKSIDSGATWLTIPTPKENDDSLGHISSIIDRDGKGLLIGRRGFVLRDTNRVDTVAGGMWRSEDDGQTWNKIPLPVDDFWVERIEATAEGCLFAWVGDFELVNDPVAGYTKVFDNDWHLLKSCDDGKAWTVVLTIPDKDHLALSAAWSIVSHGTNIAASSHVQIFRSKDAGTSWTEDTSLPLFTRVGGLAYDNEGVLWAATERGIYRMDDTPTEIDVVTENRSTNSSDLFPNPCFDTFTLRTADCKRIRLVNTCGEVVLESISHPDTNSELRYEQTFDISSLANGMYYLIVDQLNSTRTIALNKLSH